MSGWVGEREGEREGRWEEGREGGREGYGSCFSNSNTLVAILVSSFVIAEGVNGVVITNPSLSLSNNPSLSNI